MTLATLPVGYADGYIRAYRRGYALINGKRAPIVGRICMDQLMVDISDIEGVKCGDEAVMLGGGGITADELAKMSNTINYEVTCLISKRVGRVIV
jgi:alanine racemase